MSSQQSETQRELVYCHSCENEWYRDTHGLVCPQCQSDMVEIIEADHDPRQEMHEDEQPDLFAGFLQRPAQQQTPSSQDDGSGVVQHEGLDGGGHVIRRRIHFSSGGAGNASNPHDMVASMINGLFSQIGGMTPEHAIRNNQARTAQGNTEQTRSEDPAPSPGASPTPTGSNIVHPHTGLPIDPPYTRGPPSDPLTRPAPPPPYHSQPQTTTRRFQFGPMNMTFSSTSTTFVNGQQTDDDLGGLLRNAFGGAVQHDHADLEEGEQQRDAVGALSGPLAMILSNFGMVGRRGQMGDYVFTDEAVDRIMTQMMEQNQQSRAPPAASAELIDALPKVKATEESEADCPICITKVDPGEEVAVLPCKHSYHFECIRAWLSEHDSCPTCRRGITPRDGPADRPRNEGEMPRHWQADPSSPTLSRSNTAQSTTPGPTTSSEGPPDRETADPSLNRPGSAAGTGAAPEGLRDWVRNSISGLLGRSGSTAASQNETSRAQEPSSRQRNAPSRAGGNHGLDNPDVD